MRAEDGPDPLLADVQMGAPVTPAIVQENWALWRQSVRRWPLIQRGTGDVKSRRVRFWGPTAIECPAGKGLGTFVAYKVGLGGFGIVLDSKDPRWVDYHERPPSERPSLKFQVELRGYWRRPFGFSECPECRKEIYALRLPTPDWHHQPGDDPHPGYTTTEPPMIAFALFRCSRCSRIHVADAVALGRALFGAPVAEYRLRESEVLKAIPGSA